ncbi:MAG TPA: NnrS family protein [Sulfurovum sp.]|nr:NnrS family protein [Sulfurovum sp.]
MHMQFSEDSQHSYFISQPHQPFFVLAFINALITMLIFMLSYKGIINLAISPTDYHSYGLIFLLFTPAFFAFLFTTFPRFSSTPAIDKKVYMRIFNFYYIGSILFVLGSLISPILSSIGMIVVFIGHILGMLVLKKIYTTTQLEDKDDIYWILLATQFGVLSHFVFILGQLFFSTFIGFALEIAIYLFLFLLSFSVAQRMVPFFSHAMIEKNKQLLKHITILIVLHILFEGFLSHSSFIVDFLLALLIGKELLRWKLPFPKDNPLLAILHISLYWVPLAFALAGVTNFISLFSPITFLALDIHVLALGFVFTILIGFGTRVTLGHSGNMMQADTWVSYLFYWTQVVVLVRILVSIVAAFGWNFIVLFDISVITWIIMFIAWAVRFFAVLIKGKKLVN